MKFFFLNSNEPIFQNKDDSQNPHEDADIFSFPADGIEQGVADNTEGDAFRDGIHESHGGDADEARDGFR